MPRNINWDETGKRIYETGVDRGVLYRKQVDGSYKHGVAWNGLTNVSENPTGAEPNPIYADNIKYLNLLSVEESEGTIEAYTYPDEFSECDGTAELTTGVLVGQQPRKTFGLAYRTKIGNDVDGEDHGYKLHLLYGALAAPSEKSYQTINDSPEAVTFSWDYTTTPVEIEGMKPSAIVVIDSTKVDSAKLAALEAILYGVDAVEGRLPLPDEVLSIIESDAPSAVALSSSVPVDEATDVAIDSTVVLTFNNAIMSESISMIDELGDPVAFAKSWDSESKVLTLTPSSNLDNNVTYIVTVAGVVDVYSQALATESINFTTVAL